MKIAFVVLGFPELSQTFILNQITGLIDRGHSVDIYALKGSEVETSKLHPNVEKYQLLARTYYYSVPNLPRNIFWRLLKGFGLLTAKLYKSPEVWLRSLNIFQRSNAMSLRPLYKVIPLLGKPNQYDIIHCQFGLCGLQAMSLRKFGLLQGKLVVAFRGFDISEFIQQYGDGVYSELFKVGDFFLTNCDYFRQRLLKLGCAENKVMVHRSGLDCQRFIFNPVKVEQASIQIVTSGRLVEKKGIEYAIHAVAKLAKIKPNIEYKVIGDGPLRQPLQQLIEELNVTDTVKLLGWKDQEEIIEILKKSHIFIAPSVTAQSGDQDAPVNVLKEAMAIGLPVISTYHGGIPELIQDNVSGFLVTERNADAIAKKISYLLDNPQIWEQIAQAARREVETNYDLHKLNDELVDIYQQLLMQGFVRMSPQEVVRTAVTY
ncbi:glycosyltransferase [Gloeocapsopsis dulcis]|uniref:Colanic acid biosynthesis glycosyltransferase WcaL n=1 Tax=Gloeocapsopsis dulcis AAB1 = 1H9 TaxID=1433147 RepID=A0A6N8FPL9_9CHRO|nr:glycosyltransferase [Gloeocapsopsis dulcis]MUL35203.1 colanic acid biosynthesis glycosyltransferase WcaL [Gloeocapsopsis dulcis AAB1 = 1H9]WNN89089.1 glycosyltransferase [Gloeocapsopsis dulcis]